MRTLDCWRLAAGSFAHDVVAERSYFFGNFSLRWIKLFLHLLQNFLGRPWGAQTFLLYPPAPTLPFPHPYPTPKGRKKNYQGEFGALSPVLNFNTHFDTMLELYEHFNVYLTKYPNLMF